MTAQAVGTRGKILVVDDEPVVDETHAFVLRDAGYDVVEQTSHEMVLGDLAANPDIDLVLLDIRMPGIDGMDLLKQIKILHSRVGVMMVSVIPDVVQVVWAMKMGAYRNDFRMHNILFKQCCYIVRRSSKAKLL